MQMLKVPNEVNAEQCVKLTSCHLETNKLRYKRNQALNIFL